MCLRRHRFRPVATTSLISIKLSGNDETNVAQLLEVRDCCANILQKFYARYENPLTFMSFGVDSDRNVVYLAYSFSLLTWLSISFASFFLITWQS
jgi:hypothetical protein